MSDMPEAKVYTDYNIGFVADQVAEIDAVQRFVIAAAKASDTFEEFKKKLDDELKEVKITQVVDVDEWLKTKDKGFILITKDCSHEDSLSDFFRDDDGLPVIYNSFSEAMENVPVTHSFVRILDLSETEEG